MQMPKPTFAVVMLLALGCTRPGVPDAGTVVERGTDLRSAITTIFPEYRGAMLAGGRAQVTRTVAPVTEAQLAEARATAVQNGFSGDPPTRKPFVLEQHLDAGVLTQELAMGLSPDELGRVVAAPAAMTSEAMAHWLPKLPAGKSHEELEVELLWIAKDVARADFLVWQLTDGALSAGWQAELPPGFTRHRPDGGAGEVPRELSLTVKNDALGARFEIERKGERARLRYVLTTFERR
jgi:hypothetical protein